jgi:hypothetical protein
MSFARKQPRRQKPIPHLQKGGELPVKWQCWLDETSVKPKGIIEGGSKANNSREGFGARLGEEVQSMTTLHCVFGHKSLLECENSVSNASYTGPKPNGLERDINFVVGVLPSTAAKNKLGPQRQLVNWHTKFG